VSGALKYVIIVSAAEPGLSDELHGFGVAIDLGALAQ
jgi:hypothetical protein